MLRGLLSEAARLLFAEKGIDVYSWCEAILMYMYPADIVSLTITIGGIDM